MRNLYALTPGELLVGQELEKRGYEVYIPTKDKGIDLLATKVADVLTFQVKESRVYLQSPGIRSRGGPAWTSWTQLTSSELKNAADRNVDLFVFVIHALAEDGNKLKFEPSYVVIPPLDLEERLRRYRPGKDRSVYWYVDSNGKLWETRGSKLGYQGARDRDFTEYLEAWPQVSSRS